MQKKYSVLIIALFISFVGVFADAQVRSTDIVLSISPQYPSANQNVTATLNSYSTDLNKANIFWSTSGQETSGGIGKKTFTFKTSSLGNITTLSATINTIDGQSISKTITINPADVDILWEAYDSYAPPFYRGKKLAPSQGAFKVVAIPSLINQGGKVNINNLSYLWVKDGKNQPSSSGWGKNYFIFQNSYLDKDNTVEVKVSDISGINNGSNKITLRTTNPKIIFYKNDPIMGTRWEESINNGFTINKEGEIIIVEPYFFSPKNINSSDLSFDWYLNETKIETPNPKNILSIKPEEGQSGDAVIKVMINNIETLFQSMSNQLRVSF